jgi:DHA1 family bicyclomycin/chloramphenicol resistance-like MFS transporter
MAFTEFVVLMATVMALTSLAVSMMLAVLAEIGTSFGVDATGTQSVLTAFFIGFSAGQFVVGPFADRFGRRAVMLACLAIYLVASVLCVISPTLETLLVARGLQGLGAAAPRVITISVVRDCYSGRRMASVISLAMTVLMVVPVIAPTIGQIIVLVAPWRWIFVCLALYGVVATVWLYLRLPETQAPEDRRSLQPRAIAGAVRQVLTSRRTLGYMLATGVCQGLLLATLYAAPQVMGELLGMGHYFTVAFGVAAAAMSLGQFFNARLVGRFGMRLLSHGAVAVGTLLCVALLSLIAHSIGLAYDGTMLPLATGLVACGVAILGIAAITERGRLFVGAPPTV